MCWREEKSKCFTLNCKYHCHHLGRSSQSSSSLLYFWHCARQHTNSASNPHNSVRYLFLRFYRCRTWHSKWLTICQSYPKEFKSNGAETAGIVKKFRVFSERLKNLNDSHIKHQYITLPPFWPNLLNGLIEVAAWKLDQESCELSDRGQIVVPLFRPESLNGHGMVFIRIILRILSNHTYLPSAPP